MKMKLLSFLLVFISTSIFAARNLSIDIEKQIFDYKIALEKNIERKLQVQSGLEQVKIRAKVKPIFSSERIKKLKKDLIFPVSSIDTPEYNKVFIDELGVTVFSPVLLTPKLQNIVREEVKEITGFNNVNITFNVKGGTVFQTYQWYFLGGAIICVMILGVFASRKLIKKEEPDYDSINDVEEKELENNLLKLVSSLKKDRNVLNKYMNRRNFDSTGLKTLLIYLDMKFKKEEVFTRDNLKIINAVSGVYSPREFKIWLVGFVDSMDIVESVDEDVELSDVYSFDLVSSITAEEYEEIFPEIDETEIISYLATLPDNIKFNAIEALKKIEIENLNEILSQISQNSDEEKNFEALRKIEIKLNSIREEKARKQEYEAA